MIPAGWRQRLRTVVRLLGRRCAVCHARCPNPEPALGLCPTCAGQLAPRLGGHCPGCGALYASPDQVPHLCGDCLRHPRPWSNFAFFAAYEGLLAELVKAYKFREGLGYGAVVQGLTLRAFDLHTTVFPDLLVPVPLHPSRLAWRGYNQSLELARRLSRERGLPLVASALSRIRATRPQSSLERAQRLTNLQGAFAAEPAVVAGGRVLLVDDVMTTGATLVECAQALHAAGAAGVDVLVVGRG